MAVNPMQRKSRISFLLGMIITLLITGVIIVFLFFQLRQKNEELQAEIGAKQSVYVLNQDVKGGQVLTDDMFVTKQINVEEIPANATSLSDVVSSWFLQTEDGKVLYRDAVGLYIDESDSIIELYNENGQYYNQDTDEPVSLRGDPYQDEVDGETKYFVTDNNSIDELTRVYEDLNTGNCYIYRIDNNTLSREYITLNTVPLLAKIDLKANTVMTRDYVVQSDAVVTKDVRRQEYNMIVLPMDLETNDYVDIRLMLPNGQNFIVLSKVQVEIPLLGDGTTYVEDTIWVNLREDEILTLSSAIVEAYGISGAYLYANKYVEAGLQEAAVATYVPNSSVTAQLGPIVDGNGVITGFSNQNLVVQAMEGLRQRYQNTSIRNEYIQPQIDEEQSYDNNVQAGLNESVTASESSRLEYLQSLNYGN